VKYLLALLLFALSAPAALAQIQPVNWGAEYLGTFSPGGQCQTPWLLRVGESTGDLYTCQNGVWAKAQGTGTVNHGTATQVAYYAGTGAVISGASHFLTDGSHQAMGAQSAIDSNPNDGSVPIVLNVSEQTTDLIPGIGLSAYRKWQPISDAASFTAVQAASLSAYINTDGQATANLQDVGLGTYVENDSAVRDVDLLSGASLSADQNGAGTVRHLFGSQSAVYTQHGTVSEDAIGVLSSAGISGDSHVSALWGFYADPPSISDTALVDLYTGFQVHAPLNTSSHPIGTFKGIQLDVSTTAGTVTKAIDSTGNAPSFFAGSLQATLFQETLTTPASSSAACTAGQFTDDASFHYVCTATNTWKRAALSTF
jgi:hypothetical protein